ncbi:MAG: LysM peptidoglycan-binding domain-containing protein [Actinobacteria bacterium]|nr:LysM peptidoglycan-binding domain-containing protein [Actinomycetota bacterium]
MRGRNRYSVWTIVAPLALVGVFGLSVMLVRDALDRPAAPAPAAAETAVVEDAEAAEPVTVGADVPPSYTIRKGDTLSAVAERYGLTEDYIRGLNPGLDPLALIPGERIKLRDSA